MQTVTKAAQGFGLAANDFSSAQSDADFSKLSDLEQSFSDQNKGFEKASQNVDKYAKDKCGIDLNSDSSTHRAAGRRAGRARRATGSATSATSAASATSVTSAI